MRDWLKRAIDWLIVFISRLANVASGGDWELFCTRVHRNQWTSTASILDAIWLATANEDRHTRRAYIWDRRYNGRPR